MRQIAQWIIDNTLLLLLAAGTIYSYSCLVDHGERLRIGKGAAAVTALLHTLVGVVCVKTFAFLEGTANGMSLYGSIFFMPVLYFAGAKLLRRRVSDVFDCFTFCIVFTLMCARVNCLIAGCCLGKLIPGSESLRWPTRQLEIVFYLTLLFVLFRKAKKEEFRGRSYPLFMMSYGAFRFVVEWFRESEHIYGYLHISHIWSLVAIAIGAAFYFVFLKKLYSGKNQNEAESPK